MTKAKFDDFFKSKVCINLDRRADRWRDTELQLRFFALQGVTRFAAVDARGMPDPASSDLRREAYACLLSHLAVVKEARSGGHENVLILEDDIFFTVDFRERFEMASPELPEDWDLLLLGGNYTPPPLVPVAPHLFRCRRTFGAYAYALRRSLYDPFIELLEKAEESVDGCLALLQERYNCYRFIPDLICHLGIDSDIPAKWRS